MYIICKYVAQNGWTMTVFCQQKLFSHAYMVEAGQILRDTSKQYIVDLKKA